MVGPPMSDPLRDNRESYWHCLCKQALPPPLVPHSFMDFPAPDSEGSPQPPLSPSSRGEPRFVRKTWRSMEARPLWIGSALRSPQADSSEPFTRIVRTERPLAEFRLAWQDPEEPEWIHPVGAFQIDLTRDTFFTAHRLEFQRAGPRFLGRLGGEEWEELVRWPEPHRPHEESWRIDSFLATEVLGRLTAEILIRYLHRDAVRRSLQRKLLAASGMITTARPLAPARDQLLRHAWDNHQARSDQYTSLGGRWGMFLLAP